MQAQKKKRTNIDPERFYNHVNRLFWSCLVQIEKNDEQMNSELLVKIMLDSCGYVQQGVPLRNVYKNFPRYSQRLFAFGFLPWFFLNFLCISDDVLLKCWWKKKNCMQFLCSLIFYFQRKTIPFCKTIITTFSKQHTSCIWTAYFFFYCSSKVQNNFIKMTKNRKW